MMNRTDTLLLYLRQYFPYVMIAAGVGLIVWNIVWIAENHTTAVWSDYAFLAFVYVINGFNIYWGVQTLYKRRNSIPR